MKWKTLVSLSLALVFINAVFAYLVHGRNIAELESLHAQKLASQARELRVTLDLRLESVSAFAAFIPRLASSRAQTAAGLHSTMRAVLDEYGPVLEQKWGVSRLYYLAPERSGRRPVSWPAGSEPAQVEEGQPLAKENALSRTRLVCGQVCFQRIVLPVQHAGAAAGVLLVERPVSESLTAFSVLSGADAALINTARSVVPHGPTHHPRIFALTNPQTMAAAVRAIVARYSPAELAAAPRRIQLGGEWFESFPVGEVATGDQALLLGVNRVTGLVSGIQGAPFQSLVLGVVGLVFSVTILVVLLWKPMQRIEDIMSSLPLLSQRLFERFRDELPARSQRLLPPDEIDVMSGTIRGVSEQMEMLDSARLASERALRESERNLGFAHSLARVATWHGEPLSGRFAFSSGSLLALPVLEGISSWDGFLALVHPEDRGELRIAWRRGMPGTKLDQTFRLCVDDREIYVRAIAEYEMLAPDFVLMANGMMQDVSEIQYAQQSLVRDQAELNREAEEGMLALLDTRNEALREARQESDSLAKMSHEIRTPLNAVLGLSQIGYRESANRKIAETFGQILDAGEHLLNVVNEVLDHAKLEAGMLTVSSDELDLFKVLDRSIAMVSQQADDKGLALEREVCPTCPRLVAGDAFRLQQILINLLANAVKFTDEGAIELVLHCEAGELVFRIRDTGIGMTRAQMSKLFVPYQQAGEKDAVQRQGTGLGLCISNRLAQLMGGEIQVRSRLGEGSEFVLRLPLRASGGGSVPERGEPISLRPGTRRLEGVRILLADDVVINREVLKGLLALEGAEVEAVVDGVELVEAVTAGGSAAFDMIFVDVEMPRLNGRDATRRLRAAGVTLPVVGVSAHASVEEKKRSLAAGMDGHLAKPVLHEELVDTVLGFVQCGGRCAAVASQNT